jgi:hypothetical protein
VYIIRGVRQCLEITDGEDPQIIIIIANQNVTMVSSAFTIVSSLVFLFVSQTSAFPAEDHPSRLFARQDSSPVCSTRNPPASGPASYKNAGICARGMIENKDPDSCTITGGGRESVLEGCLDSSIKISLRRTPSMFTQKFDCKDIGRAALKIIESCSDCKREFCPVSGE